MRATTTEVEFSFDVTVDAPTMLVLQVAPSVRPGSTDTLTASNRGGPLSASRLIDTDGNVIDILHAGEGRVAVRYRASVPMPARASWRAASELDEIVYCRPSRFCPSDRMGERARPLAGPDPLSTVRNVVEWVHTSLRYEAGVSTAETDAIETLDAGAGVCRDFAHAVVALCRALEVPARVAAVYAPGLSPMDFHLVAETAIKGTWYVWDATRLASRHHLVRIATGRDAADVSFCTSIGPGNLELTALQVTAVAGLDILPDDITSLVPLS